MSIFIKRATGSPKLISPNNGGAAVGAVAVASGKSHAVESAGWFHGIALEVACVSTLETLRIQ